MGSNPTENGDSCVVAHEDGTRTHRVTLWYPATGDRAALRPHTTIDAVEVQLVHVRAARDIRITYDFDRDGYVIAAQADPGEPGPDAMIEAMELPYLEVAFVPAWADGETLPYCSSCTGWIRKDEKTDGQ